MKTKIIITSILLMGMIGCKKNNNPTNESSTSVTTTDKGVEAEITYESEAKETIKITYFADGSLVGVKLLKNNEPERTLKAITEGHHNTPAFSDGKVTWEVSNENVSGTYTDEKGSKTIYQRK